MIPHSNRLAALLLGCLAVWAPVPFGSARPDAVFLLEIGSLAALALAAIHRGARWRFEVAARPVFLLLAFAGLALLQTLPLPAQLVGLLSPVHLKLFAGAAGGATGWAQLSLAPEATRAAMLWTVALTAAFVAALLVSERRVIRRGLLGSVVAVALGEALFGYQQWRAGVATIWGVDVPQPPGRLRGTFVNANHLAFLLGLALTVALAAVWWTLRRKPWRQRSGAASLLAGVPILIWLTLFAAVGMTGSRAGLLAALVATAVQLLLLARGKGRRWWAAATGVAALAAVGLGAALAQAGVFDRLLRTTGYEVVWNDRWLVYQGCLELWTRFPLTGSGLATFREAFPMVQPASLHEIWRHAHSDWLELLVTTGLIGFGLLGAALVSVAARFLRLQRDARRSESRAAGLAGAGALVFAAVHSTLDFSLAMPADAFVLALALGAAAGAPSGHRRRREAGSTAADAV